MADRVYPSSKPSSNPPQPQNGPSSTTPATKSQLYGSSRPAYRTNPQPRPRRRGPCCTCCLWISLLLLALLIAAAIAAAAIWFIYRPQRPSFSVSALRISSFNLSSPKDSTFSLNSHLNLSLSARNPNKKLVFFYDPISVSVLSSGVSVADGSLPPFVHGTKNTTILKGAASSAARDLDSSSAASLRSNLNRKNGLPLEIQLDTKVKVKMGAMKTKKVKIRVSCSGIEASAPIGKSTSVADSSGARCKVKIRIKIWKWQL